MNICIKKLKNIWDQKANTNLDVEVRVFCFCFFFVFVSGVVLGPIHDEAG